MIPLDRTNPISVTIVITSLSTGGAEVMLLKLLQNIDQNAFNFQVISLTTKGQIGPKIEEIGIPVTELNLNPKFPNPTKIYKLYKILRTTRPDILHTWMYHADLIGGFVGFLAGIRCIIWGIRNSDLSKNKSKLSTILIMKLCGVLSHIIPIAILSCSRHAADIHIDNGYCKHKMHVIPNGFDLEKFKPDLTARDSVRFEMGVPSNTPLVGLIARYNPQKNHLGFIDAAREIIKQVPETHFILAGLGVDHDNTTLSQSIQNAGIQGKIHLLGLRSDIPRLIGALDVLASSSSYGEAFPNVLGEAMSCAVPCVSTDVGDSADIIGDSRCIVPVDNMKSLADAVVRILRMPPKDCDNLKTFLQTRVRTYYDINYIVQLYASFYREMARRK